MGFRWLLHINANTDSYTNPYSNTDSYANPDTNPHSDAYTNPRLRV